MSDKVYGFCDAGCKRRVPTYDEFESIGAFIKQEPDENGYYKLERNKKYKVFATKFDGGKYFAVQLHIKGNKGTFTESSLFPTRVPGDPYFTIMPIFYEPSNMNSLNYYTFTVEYLYNEEGKEYTKTYQDPVNTIADFYISGANEVYLINDEAEVVVRGEDGKSAYEIAKDNGFEGTEEEWLASIGGGIVVPDTSTSQRGTAGLVYMYNESSGLRLDNDKRLCIAPASKSDIDAGTSNNKPIVPAYIKYAMQSKSFTDDISNIIESSPDAKTPAGALAIKDFVFNNALNFKLHKIPRGETFKITPGMMALILPYGDYTLSAHKSDGTTVASSMGATIVMATDWGADADNANNYWVAFMYVKSATLMPTMSSNHNAYTANCYIKNNDSGTDGTGYAYVYYLSRPTNFTYTLLEGDTYSVKAADVNNLPSEVVIPSTYNGKVVNTIEEYAFDGASITRVTIPDTIEKIGEGAFMATDITSVIIPVYVTSIGESAFEDCDKLTSVIFKCDGESIGLIPRSMFCNCASLTDVTIPDGITTISSSAFSGCSSLTSIVIPDSVTVIGAYAFEDCANLTIYCEAASQPSGWDTNWNSSGCEVVWGYVDEK